MNKQKNPHGYWTKERCQVEAKKYASRNEFHINSKAAYGAAWTHGWLEEICAHMKLKSMPPGYWTKKRCKERALSFHRRIDFRKDEPSAYSTAWRMGWLDEICNHMDKPYQYSKEECQKIALNYQVERYWRINQCASYLQAERNGWLPELTAHMKKMHRYSKMECQIEAKKYITRKEFIEKAPQYYFRACKKHWIKDICSHMERIGNHEFRKIYVFEFDDHHAYVGLAKNPKERENEHLRSTRSYVYKYIKETGCKYVFKELSDFIPKDLASKQEDIWINQYIDMGWQMINQRAGGALGFDPTKYTKEICAQVAKKYQYRIDFIKGDKAVYNAASRKGYLKEICAHMKPKRQMPTKEVYKEIALSYKTLADFINQDRNAYNYIIKHGWNEELCSHLKKRRFWTKESVIVEAKKYKSRMAFRRGSQGACEYAIKHGFYEQCCEHMKYNKKDEKK